MPKDPSDGNRSADAISCAVHVGKIAPGEIEDTKSKQPGKRIGGSAGGNARKKALSKSERSEIAKKAQQHAGDRLLVKL